MAVSTRQTAEERREAVLAAAQVVFAHGGLHGSSTEEIAEAAGISQPYLFRLFGTKKKLFVATVERCMQDTLELFREAAGDLRGEEALQAMGHAYVAMVLDDRARLLAQLQAYAACDDDEPWPLLEPLDELPKKVRRGIVHPVRVLEDQQRRLEQEHPEQLSRHLLEPRLAELVGQRRCLRRVG